MPPQEIVPFDQRAIERFGSDKHREAALRILGAQMGLSRSEVDDPAALSALVQAVQLAVDYGAAPNDMHIVSYDRRVQDAHGNWVTEKTYTLIDGVELWMKMLNRQYGHGNWTIDTKAMTEEEVRANAEAQGFPAGTKATFGKGQYAKTVEYTYPKEMVGYWARVLTRLDVELGVNVEYVPGMYFGWTKVGNNWFEDRLPTGASPIEVALRRARKKAAKAKGTGLIALDDRTPDQREDALFAAAERQGEILLREEQVPDSYDKTDDSGLFAMPDPQEQAAAAAREAKNSPEPEDGHWEYMDSDELDQWAEAVEQPAKWHTLPVNHPLFEAFPDVPALLQRMLVMRRKSGPTLSQMAKMSDTPPDNSKKSDRQLWAMTVSNAIKTGASEIGIELGKDDIEALRHRMYDALCGYSVADNGDAIPQSYNAARLFMWQGGKNYDPAFEKAFIQLATLIVEHSELS